LSRPKEGGYASREQLTGGLFAPALVQALVPGVTIDVAGLLA